MSGIGTGRVNRSTAIKKKKKIFLISSLSLVLVSVILIHIRVNIPERIQIKVNVTTQKMKFLIKGFSCTWDQICRKLRILSYLMKKSYGKLHFFVQCVGPKWVNFTDVLVLHVNMSSKLIMNMIIYWMYSK